MSLSKSHLAYRAEYDAFDAALADPVGARQRFPDHDAAYRFRAKLHQARAVDRERSKQIFDAGDPAYGTSAYDDLICTLRREGDDFYVYIRRSVGREGGPLEPLSQVTTQTLPAPTTEIPAEMLERMKRG